MTVNCAAKYLYKLGRFFVEALKTNTYTKTNLQEGNRNEWVFQEKTQSPNVAFANLDFQCEITSQQRRRQLPYVWMLLQAKISGNNVLQIIISNVWNGLCTPLYKYVQAFCSMHVALQNHCI